MDYKQPDESVRTRLCVQGPSKLILGDIIWSTTSTGTLFMEYFEVDHPMHHIILANPVLGGHSFGVFNRKWLKVYTFFLDPKNEKN